MQNLSNNEARKKGWGVFTVSTRGTVVGIKRRSSQHIRFNSKRRNHRTPIIPVG
jgi:hypothetical protein